MSDVSDPFSDAYDAFAQVESKLDAHTLKIADVNIWSALRYDIFERVLVQAKIVGHFQAPRGGSSRRFLRLPQNIVRRNPFRYGRTAENVVIKWARLEKTELGADDIITRPITNFLPPDETVELDVFDNISNPGEQSFSTEAIACVVAGIKHFSPTSPSASTRVRVAEVERAIRQAFGVEMPLENEMSKAANKFGVQRQVFRALFRKWRTRRIFVVAAYGHMPLTAAAHDCDAEVIEMQHGAISRCHAGYDYPDGAQPIYGPDTLLLFGEDWRDAARFAPHLRQLVFGAPWIRTRLDAATQASTSGNREEVALFISQPSICMPLLDFAIRYARLAGAPPVLFRLHPGDNLAAIQAMLESASLNASQFRLSHGGGGAITLWLQTRAAFQVGVYSTAISEGLAIGTRTFLAPLPGWSWNRHLLEKHYVQIAQSPEVLLDLSRTMQQHEDSKRLLDRLFSKPHLDLVQALTVCN